MTLTNAQRRELNALVRRIDHEELTKAPGSGLPGQFLRDRVAWVRDRTLWLAKSAATLIGAGPEISGDGHGLGPITLRPLKPPTLETDGSDRHQRAVATAVSEELGGVIELVLWLSGASGTEAYNILLDAPAVQLTGSYRWTAPARVTCGEAERAPHAEAPDWDSNNWLKAVADDLHTQQPHAGQYVWDGAFGFPGPKYFRCVGAQRTGNTWHVLPAFMQSIPLQFANSQALSGMNGSDFQMLLVYCEPWSPGDWWFADNKPATVDAVYRHAVAWSDAEATLDGQSTSRRQRLAAITRVYMSAGLDPGVSVLNSSERALLPLALELRRYLERRR